MKFKFSSIFIFAVIQLFLIMPICINTNEINITSYQENSHELISSLTPLSLENETLLTHQMNVKVQLDNSIKITSTFVLTNNDSQPIDFFILTINETITSVFCDDPIGSLDFRWTFDPLTGNLINITMRYPLLSNDIYVFSVSYEIENVIYSVEGVVDYNGLDYEVIHPRNTMNFELVLCLPVYAELLTENPPDPVFPSADKIFEENEIVKITWYLTNRVYNENDVFLIRFVQESPFSPSNNKALFYVLSVLGGAILGSVVVFLVFTIRRKPADKQLVTSLLTDTEQEVIKAINTDSGISTQRRICDKTGYSKSKVSQILAKLEEKKVLKRERWGRTNKVTITNPSFRQLGSIEEKETTSEY
ncbi:MAG: winged helix-turn-helix transcriptional regulator [Asgard group archaeon]|nr:winged helix-turn-helix transcriptional regulator [Asgard group archaeon]